MANELLGNDYFIFYDTAANYTTPTWVKQISFGDAGYDPGNAQVEIPLRIGFTTYKKGRSDGSLTFTMNYDPSTGATATWHKAVRDAIRSGNRIHLALAEGSVINSSDHLRAWFMLSGGNNASLDDVASYDVEGKFHHDIGVSMTEIPAYVEGV